MNQPLPVQGNLTATVYSVEPVADNSSAIVITVATDSRESPAALSHQLTSPLQQVLEEVADINEQISFTVVASERYGMLACQIHALYITYRRLDLWLELWI